KFLSSPIESIDIETPFEKYGLDSAKAVLMVGKLEDLLDVELPSTLLWDYNNIKALSEHLSQNISQYQ
ncbi:MAG TPA: acyl carrier protein, partial [Bacteroidales bacterium]|nr:acyl carrier protein [Bacteroidales bacterium]